MRGALVTVLVGALFAAGGAFGGLLWDRTTTPVKGLAYQGRFLVVGAASGREFAATGHYVVIALVVGLALGLATALIVRGHELVTLPAVAAAAVGAAVLMSWLGHRLGPADPGPLARSADDFTKLPQDLSVHGVAAYAAWPAGALVGLVIGLVGLEVIGGFGKRRAAGMTTLSDISSY